MIWVSHTFVLFFFAAAGAVLAVLAIVAVVELVAVGSVWDVVAGVAVLFRIVATADVATLFEVVTSLLRDCCCRWCSRLQCLQLLLSIFATAVIVSAVAVVVVAGVLVVVVVVLVVVVVVAVIIVMVVVAAVVVVVMAMAAVVIVVVALDRLATALVLLVVLVVAARCVSSRSVCLCPHCLPVLALLPLPSSSGALTLPAGVFTERSDVYSVGMVLLEVEGTPRPLAHRLAPTAGHRSKDSSIG